MMEEIKDDSREKCKTNVKNSSLTIYKMDNKATYELLKRIIDIVGSFTGIVIFFPFMFLIGMILKFEDPRSPILFSQVRIGKDGKLFRMYKFRSMWVDAEKQLEQLMGKNEIAGAMFKIKDDPRITKVGRVLRKKSIDEFPQLWNVLIGDMSLVGPRPPLEREVKEYTAYDLQRLSVKPGCSGLWQISGRSNMNFDQMVNLDLEYIRSRSITSDLKIIILTVIMLIRPNHDAY